MAYEIESYWNDVASQLKNRNDGGEIAGDDDPFYFYKRKSFLNLFRQQKFQNKKVLEVGSGPGGNLEVLLELLPKHIAGADISDRMIEIARSNPKLQSVTFKKTDGKSLPFNDGDFDVIYTVTVLQHIVDENMLKALINEICRVSNAEVLIFERIEKSRKESPTNVGRTVQEYSEMFNKHGFALSHAESLQISASYYVSGAIRKIFNSNKRKEGEPQSKLAIGLQKLLLPLTKIIDPLVPTSRDLTLLHFKK